MTLPQFDEHWLGFFGTALVVISYIPQITHLLKQHCGEGVSLWAYGLWASSSALLCGYALMGQEPIFTVLQGYHAAACLLILMLGAKYRTSRCPAHQTKT